MLRKRLMATILATVLAVCGALAACGEEGKRVLTGDERFDEYIPLLDGKRVALFSNHTGIVGDETSLTDEPDIDRLFGLDAQGNEITYGEHVLDALIVRNVDVVAVFSPEHGFRGTQDAGASVDNSVDEKTGIPILSLYGPDTHYPAQEDMDRFDTLLVDIQDVGLRYYTYYLSLYYLMEACAADNKEVIILDRPNPNGFYVDGPILQDAYRSGVGQLPLPIVYGMTLGELSQMINGEGWLSTGKESCDLTVIPCGNYTHQTKTSLIRNPSPNLKNMRAVYLYASTCFFENTQMSVGRGTWFPFEVYGGPCLEGNPQFPFTFTPVSMSGALEPPFMDQQCYGEDLRNIPLEEIWGKGVNPAYLIKAYQAYMKTGWEEPFWGTADEKGQYWIDKLSGSADLRLMIEAGKSAEEIKDSWAEDVRMFMEQRRPYLLYAE
ncbi:MAG: DUF1343 domain-containing protein [Blautia sp.]|nr:DUF1343 domain-containing protein [Blautia sp.]